MIDENLHSLRTAVEISVDKGKALLVIIKKIEAANEITDSLNLTAEQKAARLALPAGMLTNYLNNIPVLQDIFDTDKEVDHAGKIISEVEPIGDMG